MTDLTISLLVSSLNVKIEQHQIPNIRVTPGIIVTFNSDRVQGHEEPSPRELSSIP